MRKMQRVWRWLLAYRRRSRPLVRRAIAAHAGGAALHVLTTPRAVRRFIAEVDRDPPRSS